MTLKAGVIKLSMRGKHVSYYINRKQFFRIVDVLFLLYVNNVLYQINANLLQKGFVSKPLKHTNLF